MILPWAMQARVSLMLARTTRDPFDRQQRLFDYERALAHLRKENDSKENIRLSFCVNTDGAFVAPSVKP